MKSKSFKRSMLLSVGGVFLLFALCFSIYQYRREKEFKIDILHSQLQMYNQSLIHSIGLQCVSTRGCEGDVAGRVSTGGCEGDVAGRVSTESDSVFRDYVARNNIEGLRVTVIDLEGNVLMDSREQDVTKMGNHLMRNEVRMAIKEGQGYDLKRTSESTRETYFYSATKSGDIIIRTAIPYSAELTQSLKADNTFIYYAIVLTLLLGIVLYLNASRISRHISYLREFATKAERGERLDSELERKMPDDELGEISHTIIALYWKLKHSEEDKVRIKRQLTENAAHELKTPAASIHGYLESMLEHPDMDEAQRQHFIERCYAQSERMGSLLRDMGSLARLDEMKESGAIEKETIVVARVVENVVEESMNHLQEKGIECKTDIADDVVIRGDSGLIYGIFRNLMDNALAYATGASLIMISAIRTEDGMFRFVFADNGVGVEPQHLELLFERFYRVDKGRSRKVGGTGLGLAIVRNSVQVHGGEIHAERTKNGGLTIVFTLKM